MQLEKGCSVEYLGRGSAAHGGVMGSKAWMIVVVVGVFACAPTPEPADGEGERAAGEGEGEGDVVGGGESCADAFVLTSGTTVTSTLSLTNNDDIVADPTCGGSGSRELVYSFTLTEPAGVELSVE